MEQRPLLVVALLAGCVTAAGAGGFLAVRHAATPAAPVTATETVGRAESAPAPVVDGTEGEILPPADAATEAPVEKPRTLPERASARATATPPAPSRPAVSSARTAPERATPTPPARPASQPASVPERSSRPTQPESPTSPAISTPRQEDAAPTAPRDARDAVTTNESRWPASNGAEATQTTSNDWPRGDSAAAGADTSLPSRPVEEAASSAPVRRAETVTIPADAVIGVQLESSVSSQTARVEDPVRARVSRDVYANGSVIVPAGARLLGSVTLVEEGGKIRERARLGVRFHTLVLSDGSEVRLPTETIYRDGDSPAGRSAAKIGGGAVGGAILGAILGGGRGAVIGAATGAGSGTAVAMAGERRPAELRSGEPVTVRVSSAVTSQVER